MPPIATADLADPAATAPFAASKGSSASAPPSSKAAPDEAAERFDNVWRGMPTLPLDPMFHLNQRFVADQHPDKINLGIGAYRGEDARPWPLPSLQGALRALTAGESGSDDPATLHVSHEYLGMDGLVPFTREAAKLLFGPDEAATPLLASMQTTGGSGANHFGACLIQRFYRGARNERNQAIVYLSNPGWPNHRKIFEAAGAEVREYDYFTDRRRPRLELATMLEQLEAAPEQSVVVLHPCGHNPTGWDPSEEQWQRIADVMLRRRLYAFFDSAYQGFASGQLDRDAYAVRLFARLEVPMLVCQSFSKNMGLYGQRLGCIHVACHRSSSGDGDAAASATRDAVQSQLRSISREEISTPPRFPADLAHLVLTRPELKEQWHADMATMSARIRRVRTELVRLLTEELRTPGDWTHIALQRGMFAYLQLSPEQCARLVEEGHIYLTPTGRASVSGLNDANVRHLAVWIDRVVRETPGIDAASS
ncbi:uncharacterized protein PFL1_03508 [Pseudozyma flocculosa PF-1]|uniref:Aspartate aminotransferase n=2 Tax=Pseudozyma flocculosa TaxID=84751 RepID=A0A5C3FBH0_9BASI|nr:uncharacterized protein PFL1_03508 [Pseudozyma flocculosa PF-1]EPQ29221.1 hypothetical protein PFL1_03508 [Pseudozyma flocculosa PF-1]SPO41476.1 related to aspartate aminotransferase, cytoplasmic [Pseudozyma flocculosa]